jgi:hypothetical protein
VSASIPGSVISPIAAARRPAPRRSRMPSSTARYSRASSRARSDATGLSGRGSVVTQVARPAPRTPVPMVARTRPRTRTACRPPGSFSCCSIAPITPTAAYRLSMRGTSTRRESAVLAASTAASTSGVSTTTVATMPGTNTPPDSGRSGSVTAPVRSVVLTYYSLTRRSNGENAWRGPGIPRSTTCGRQCSTHICIR